MPLPTVSQFNNNFMANNPQYGYNGKPNPTSSQSFSLAGANNPMKNVSSVAGAFNFGQTANNMSSTTPMGAPAKAPQTASPVNTIQPSQVKPTSQTQTAPVGNATTASTSTGLVGSPSAINPNTYGQAATGLLNAGDLSKDAGYQKLLGEYNNISQSAPEAQRTIMNDTTRGIPNTVEQSRLGETSQTYSAQLAAKQAEISNYLSARGQSIGALGSAANATAPSQVSPGNFYVNPLTGQDVSGGSINPFTGGQRQAQVTLGQQSVANNANIDGARNLSSQFNSMLSSVPGFNQNDTALANAFVQAYQNNTSNPQFPQLQTTFNSILNAYRPIIGDAGISTLLTAARGSTMSALIASLDRQASAVNAGNYSAGQSGNVTSPAPTVIQPQAPNATGSTYKGITLPN